MKFEEILPKFRNGAKIARKEWIESEYPYRKYIYLEKTGEILSVDRYGEFTSYFDFDQILEEDWVIVSETEVA